MCYLTVPELAERLRVSRPTAYRLAREVIPSLRVGRTIRLKLSDVEEYERAATNRPGTQNFRDNS